MKIKAMLFGSVAAVALATSAMAQEANDETMEDGVVVEEGGDATMALGAGQVVVEQAEPTVDVAVTQPEVTVDQAAPEITVEQPQPEVIVSVPEPTVTVEQQAPIITITQAQPQVTVRIPEP
ncbi:MAG: PRC-barrel domain-containing protein, partial [Shimia sp.]